MKKYFFAIILVLSACSAKLPTAPTSAAREEIFSGIVHAGGVIEFHTFPAGRGHYTVQIIALEPNPKTYLWVGIGGKNCDYSHIPNVGNLQDPPYVLEGELEAESIYCVGVENSDRNASGIDLQYTIKVSHF